MSEETKMKLTFTIDEAQRFCSGIGRTKLYEAINSGNLKAKKFGNLIRIDHISCNLSGDFCPTSLFLFHGDVLFIASSFIFLKADYVLETLLISYSMKLCMFVNL